MTKVVIEGNVVYHYQVTSKDFEENTKKAAIIKVGKKTRT